MEGLRIGQIGIGFGGPVDSARGLVLTSHQIAGWDRYPLCAWFEEQFGIPALLENDSNCAGYAEYCCGAGRGTRQFCYMNIGSGIGGALVADGKLYTGQGLGAAEIGHTWVPDWTAGQAGVAVKLEDRCSGWSIERRIRQWKSLNAGTPLYTACGGDASQLTCAQLGEAAAAGDGRALSELDRVANALAVALGNVITLFHPERIALGGGVALMGEVLVGPLRKKLERYAFGEYRGSFEVVPCELEESVVTVGAGLIAARALEGRGESDSGAVS